MSDIFTSPYYSGSVDQWNTQAQVNQELRGSIGTLSSGLGNANSAIAKNGGDIATLQNGVTLLQSAVNAVQKTLTDQSGRIDSNQAATSAALDQMNNTLTAFGKVLDGYASQISAANTSATQAVADVTAIKTFANPDQIKQYFDLTNSLAGNIDELVNTDFLKYWTPEKADMIARLDAVVQQVSGMDTRVSKNAQDIAALSSVVGQNAQTALSNLNDAITNVRTMFRALQGELQIEQKARCETDKALQAQINNLCNKEEADVSALTKTVSDNADKAASDLDAAVSTITEKMTADEKTVSDFQTAQGQKNASQDGAIETNRKNIADGKTQLDALTTTVNTFDTRISGAESDASAAVKTANGAQTAVQAVAQQADSNTHQIESLSGALNSLGGEVDKNTQHFDLIDMKTTKLDGSGAFSGDATAATITEGGTTQKIVDVVSQITQVVVALGTKTQNLSDQGTAAVFSDGVYAGFQVLGPGDFFPKSGYVYEITAAGTYNLANGDPGCVFSIHCLSGSATVRMANGNMLSLVNGNVHTFRRTAGRWLVTTLAAQSL